MGRADELEQEVLALRERLSRLSEASLRINETLDFDSVLQGVLDSARALTKARYGVISTMDDGGGPGAVLTSGTTEEEHRQLIELPGGMKLFGHFSKLPGPLRVVNFHEYATSVGLDGRLPITVWSGLAAPIGRQGRSIGTIYLGHNKEDEEFTREDEETLAMFASQAAMVIANARRYRDEQRARTDLETLINTSPVGVAVFDARTGTAVSFNREAVRIIETLKNPGGPPEQLLEVLTLRRSNGETISLNELPLSQVLSTGETVRAEDIIMEVPDGRSVRALINATPIYSQAGEVESVVVTVQDLTPLQELERLRAEFLGMASHELRTPLASVKGSVAILLDPSASLDPAEVVQYYRLINSATDRMRNLISDLLDVVRIETGTLPVRPRPVDLAAVIDEAKTVFLSTRPAASLKINLAPGLPFVMADRLRIVQVLSNLVTNAVRQTPRSAPIEVRAVRRGIYVEVSVADEGRGIPAASLPHVFQKFSRVEGEDRKADTGLGLAICKGLVEAHGGRIWAESDGPGLGARFTFTIPIADPAASNSEPELGLTSPAAARQPGSGSAAILVVDDDPAALRNARETLTRSGYTAIVTADPEEVPKLLATEDPQLVLLDLMLPGSDGITLMQNILDIVDVPVIFVSAYGQEDIVAKAFDMGADDYIVKPFSPVELVARITAALRKRAIPERAEPYIRGDLHIDYSDLDVTIAGRPAGLTAIESRLLVELSGNAGQTLPYNRLLQRVWGTESGSDLRPVRTAIKSLRRKLGDDAKHPTYIFTEPRVGYRMVIADTPQEADQLP